MTIGTLLKRVAGVAVVAVWGYSTFHYVDLANRCVIAITPAIFEWNGGDIKNALGALRYGSPEDYRRVCSIITTINPNLAATGLNGGHYIAGETPSSTITVGSAHGAFIGWTAAVIVHETCHALQHREHRPFDETECYAAGDRTLQTIVAS